MTAFRDILRRVVDHTPGALGGSFADSQGEMVDSYTPRYDSHEWAVLTAHFGVLLGHIESLFGTWHYGGPEYFIAQHAKVEIVVHTVEGGYYAVFARRRGDTAADSIFTTLGPIREAAIALKKEMA